MKNIRRITMIISVIIILVVGYKLRLHDYNKIPFPGESMDEYSNSWVGLSLIEYGTPMGISDLPGYKQDYYRYVNVDRIYQSVASGGPLLFHRPWFDHPPTLGLLTGGYAYLKGARVYEDVTTATIRKPMVALGTLTVLLVITLGYLLAGPLVSLLAGILYATSPLLVVNSRMIQAENGYLPLLLLSIISLYMFERSQKEKFLWFAGIFSALCITIKVPGVVMSLIGIVILMTQDKKPIGIRFKESMLFTAISLLGLLLFMVYGAALDWSTFITILFSNTSRVYGIGYNAIHDLITHTKITGQKTLTDGWPLLGWLTLWVLFTKKNILPYRYLLLPVLVYLTVYLIAGNHPYGWYRIPFFPFLFISISIFLHDSFVNKRKIIMAMLALLVPIGVNLQLVTDVGGIDSLIGYWRYGILGLTTLALISIIFRNKNNNIWDILSKFVLLFLIALAIYTNLKYNHLVTIDYWYKSN